MQVFKNEGEKSKWANIQLIIVSFLQRKIGAGRHLQAAFALMAFRRASSSIISWNKNRTFLFLYPVKSCPCEWDTLL